MTSVCAIIPSSCSKKISPYLRKNINSLVNSAKKAKVKLFIIIVTNFEDIHLGNIYNKIEKVIKVTGDFNFSKMNNQAIVESLDKYKSDYILFMNDDAWVSPNFFKIFRQNTVLIKFDFLIPILYKDETRQKIDSFGIEYYSSGYCGTTSDIDTATTLASCACLFVKSNFLIKSRKKYGYFFNELLGSYYEDIEFSIRAHGINGKFIKDPNLVGYHIESFTSGHRSRYVFYKSYRNIFWVVIMSWPLKEILKYSFSIFIVQCWFIIYGFLKFGPGFTLRIFLETVMHVIGILQFRKNILSSYSKSFKLETILNGHTFKTGRGVII